MATAIHSALAIYLHTDFQPDAEFINGEIKERPTGEDDHSSWQLAICAWFREHRDQWNIRIRPELRVQVTSETYLVPDVSILDASLPKSRTATHPPLAVFEVWSPENKVRDMMIKLDLYEKMGIPQIWLLDPADPIWQRYEDGRLVDRDTFTLPERGIQFEMSEIAKLVE